MHRTKALLLLTALLLGVAGGTIHRYFQDTERLQTRYEGIEDRALRTALRDASIGYPLPPLRLRDLEGTEHRLDQPGQPHAIWIVDTDRCPNCLEDTPAWERLASSAPGLHTTLILLGMDGEAGEKAIRAKGIRGDVLVDPESDVRRLIRVPLPSIYLLTDERGLVMMADGRSAQRSCGWSFPAQLANVFGSGDSNRIRSF